METFTEKKLTEWIKLCSVNGLGPKRVGSLIERFGSLERIFQATQSELGSSHIFSERMLLDWERLKDAPCEDLSKIVRDCAQHDIKIVPLLDSRYPAKLRRLQSPPLTLFLQGNTDLLETKKIAIVGTREPSEKAKKLAFEFSKYFADLGITVISGGAEGVDTAAHEGALKSGLGKTICVFGTGLLKPFPPQNASLFRQIKESGGLLVSELPPNFIGSGSFFAQRNRITSGLSDALFVCASKETGGSMIQTKIGYDQKVPLFCPFLSLDIQPNSGIRIIVRTFGVKEVTSPQEILDCLKEEHRILQLQIC